jgi:DNA-binding transcriptional regulator YhcF (GntR family)
MAPDHARQSKCLPSLAIHYGEVRPSLNDIARRTCVCKQTVVNCLKQLELYGFVVLHRRIKRIRSKHAKHANRKY